MNKTKLTNQQPKENKEYLVIGYSSLLKKNTFDILVWFSEGDSIMDEDALRDAEEKKSPEERLLRTIFPSSIVKEPGFYRLTDNMTYELAIGADADVEWAELETL